MSTKTDTAAQHPEHMDWGQVGAASTLALVVGTYMMMVLTDPAFANAVGGQAFEDIYTTLTDWLQGTVGKIIVAAFAAVGFIAGIVQQSLMGFAVAFGAAIGLNWLPQIIDAVFSHTLPL